MFTDAIINDSVFKMTGYLFYGILFSTVLSVNSWFTNVYVNNDTAQPFAEENQDTFIFPGTRWCGAGNNARDENDFGIFYETDKCCFAHDHCPDYIMSGDSAYGLVNRAYSTRLHCSCDVELLKCLQKSRDRIATIIGTLYFDIIPTRCFKEDYPIKRCLRYKRIFERRCVQYELDQSQPKNYQWFDVPTFDLR